MYFQEIIAYGFKCRHLGLALLHSCINFKGSLEACCKPDVFADNSYQSSVNYYAKPSYMATTYRKKTVLTNCFTELFQS